MRLIESERFEGVLTDAGYRRLLAEMDTADFATHTVKDVNVAGELIWDYTETGFSIVTTGGVK